MEWSNQIYTRKAKKNNFHRVPNQIVTSKIDTFWEDFKDLQKRNSISYAKIFSIRTKLNLYIFQNMELIRVSGQIRTPKTSTFRVDLKDLRAKNNILHPQMYSSRKSNSI